MSLPLVGVHGGLDSTMGGTSSTGFSLARQDLTAQLSTPGALALRKVTTLLQGPRRDAPGEHQQAQELYSEVLKVQKSLSRPIAFNKSAEARLSQLKQEIEDEGGHSSRTATSSRGALQLQGRGSFADDGTHTPKGSGAWPGLMECLSARDGYDGRPATRDGRPCTQEGASRWRGLEGSRPVTRDGPSLDRGTSTLDGLRPSTRDGARLQQMIDGNRRSEGRPATRDRQSRSSASRQDSRQANSRKKRQPSGSHAEILSFDRSTSPEPRVPCGEVFAHECLSPCVDADESVELLE